MGLRYRNRMRLGPLPIWRNVSRSDRGKTVSWTIKIFAWSWNSRTGKSSIDLPGHYSYQTDGK